MKGRDHGILIIGGGAAGLTAAIAAVRFAAGEGRKIPVMVLEAQRTPACKLPATGNGRCNLTNRRQDIACYRSGEGTLPERFYGAGWDNEVVSFMTSLGILTHERRGGYLYPRAGRGACVAEALIREARGCGVVIRTDARAVACQRVRSGEPGRAEYETVCAVSPPPVSGRAYGGGRNGRQANAPYAEERFTADRVIMTCGGMVSPSYGCRGDGYLMAQELGHSVVKPAPALCALRSDEPHLHLAAGVRTAAEITLQAGTDPPVRERGELQITERGISGIPVMQLSRYVPAAPEGADTLIGTAGRSPRRDSPPWNVVRKVTAEIDFLPELSGEMWGRECVRRRGAILPGDTLGDFCRGLVPDKVAAWILADLGMAAQKKIVNLGSEREHCLRSILRQVRGKQISITGTDGFDRAQVTRGGIPLSEVTDRLESKRSEGLYFAGEILDVDGICGGYNLTWAFHSGLLAGREAARHRGGRAR